LLGPGALRQRRKISKKLLRDIHKVKNNTRRAL